MPLTLAMIDTPPMIPVDGVKDKYTLRILLTTECNLSCKYCFIKEKLHRYSYPSIHSLRKAIDIFSYLSIPHKNIDITGGEPFLYFNEIREISTYAHRKIPNVYISITTNGTLINKRHISFIKNNNIDLKISIDGRKESHDLNRHFTHKRDFSTYKYILKTIDMISKNKIRLKAIMVFGPDTFMNLYDNLQHLIELGFDHIDFYPQIYVLWQNSDLKILNNIFNQITELYVSCLEKNILPFSNSLLFSFLNNEGTFKQLNCNKIFVDPKGNFYCCDKVLSLPQSRHINYSVGSIKSGLDNHFRKDTLDSLRREIAQLPYYKCKDCKFIKYCFCPIGIYLYAKNYNLDTRKYFESFCNISKIYITNLLHIKSKILENKISIF